QLLTETLLLSLMGGLLGLMIGRWIVYATSGITPKGDFEFFESAYAFSLDWRIVAFTTLATFLAAIVSGLTPSIQGSRSDLVTALKNATSASGIGRPRHFRSGLVITQIALCIV